jgi:hypothetical protein
MNVLKKFLMSEVESERIKLAVVLCSILHMRPEETKAIELKWAEKKRPGGIAGWWMGAPKPSQVIQENEEDETQLHTEASDPNGAESSLKI